MRNLSLILILLPLMGISQNTLSVEVQGVKSSAGKISVAVYNTSDSFLRFDQVFKSDSTKALKGTTRLRIPNLPEGEYALAIFHDENGNDELDTNWLGIPKEDVGFSNSRMKTFGPPSFQECAMVIKADKTISISL